MPLTAKGEEIMTALKKEYGSEKGEQVFYAGKNKGTFSGVDNALRLDACARLAGELAAKADMSARDWQGVEEFISEEKNEAEHRGDADEFYYDVEVEYRQDPDKHSKRKTFKVLADTESRARQLGLERAMDESIWGYPSSSKLKVTSVRKKR
jgi:hypothetical protein